VILAFQIVLIITSLLLLSLVLLHKGRVGGGMSSGLGGSSVAERNLDRLTVGVGVIWTLSIIAIGLLMKA
jgi:preprotein translocase subunit SecG